MPFRKHLIRCGKSDIIQRRLLPSHGCSQLSFPSCIPKIFHTPLFHWAPYVVTTSTWKPALPSSTMHSKMSLCKIVLVTEPLVRKQPRYCTQDPRSGRNIKTNAWSARMFFLSSGVWSPRLTNPPNSNVCLLNEIASLNFISSAKSVPET